MFEQTSTHKIQKGKIRKQAYSTDEPGDVYVLSGKDDGYVEFYDDYIDEWAVHLPDDADPASPEQSAVAADTHATLLAAVNAMPHRDRLVLTCRYFLDLSEAETAQVLGWPRGSVKSRLSRARDKLRRALPSHLAEEVTRGG